MLRVTPFHPRTSELCQARNWRRWAGYLAAESYELTFDREYWAIRTAAALIDVSPLYKYRIQGPDAERLMDRIVTRDVRACAVGQVMYTPWCDDSGKVMDDGTLARLSEDSFRLTSADPNLNWLVQNALGMKVEVQDVSDTTAALALQGPSSRTILQSVCDADLNALRFFRQTAAPLAGVQVFISRTGYTGDLGYEIWVDSDLALPVWDSLVGAGEAYGLQPAGLLALDMARIEAGLLLIAVDYVSAREALIESRTSSPFELGLGWTVDLGKDFFVGRSALVRERERGAAWQLRGLEVQWDGLERLYAQVGLPPQLPAHAWRSSVPVYANGSEVGYATSGCWSPLLKRYIALAHLRNDRAAPGSEVQIEVTVEHQRRQAPASVVTTPFFDPARKRA
jgi:aminomethyltransferase